MDKLRINNVEVVSIKLQTSNTQFSLPILENLRGKKITAIEVFPISEVPTDRINQANCNATAFKQASLTLSINGKEKVKDLPLQSLVVSNNSGTIKEFGEVVINDQKSYISFSSTSNLVANEVIIIAFYYND